MKDVSPYEENLRSARDLAKRESLASIEKLIEIRDFGKETNALSAARTLAELAGVKEPPQVDGGKEIPQAIADGIAAAFTGMLSAFGSKAKPADIVITQPKPVQTENHAVEIPQLSAPRVVLNQPLEEETHHAFDE